MSVGPMPLHMAAVKPSSAHPDRHKRPRFLLVQWGLECAVIGEPQKLEDALDEVAKVFGLQNRREDLRLEIQVGSRRAEVAPSAFKMLRTGDTLFLRVREAERSSSASATIPPDFMQKPEDRSSPDPATLRAPRPRSTSMRHTRSSPGSAPVSLLPHLPPSRTSTPGIGTDRPDVPARTACPSPFKAGLQRSASALSLRTPSHEAFPDALPSGDGGSVSAPGSRRASILRADGAEPTLARSWSEDAFDKSVRGHGGPRRETYDRELALALLMKELAGSERAASLSGGTVAAPEAATVPEVENGNAGETGQGMAAKEVEDSAEPMAISPISPTFPSRSDDVNGTSQGLGAEPIAGTVAPRNADGDNVHSTPSVADSEVASIPTTPELSTVASISPTSDADQTSGTRVIIRPRSVRFKDEMAAEVAKSKQKQKHRKVKAQAAAAKVDSSRREPKEDPSAPVKAPSGGPRSADMATEAAPPTASKAFSTEDDSMVTSSASTSSASPAMADSTKLLDQPDATSTHSSTPTASPAIPRPASASPVVHRRTPSAPTEVERRRHTVPNAFRVLADGRRLNFSQLAATAYDLYDDERLEMEEQRRNRRVASTSALLAAQQREKKAKSAAAGAVPAPPAERFEIPWGANVKGGSRKGGHGRHSSLAEVEAAPGVIVKKRKEDSPVGKSVRRRASAATLSPERDWEIDGEHPSRRPFAEVSMNISEHPSLVSPPTTSLDRPGSPFPAGQALFPQPGVTNPRRPSRRSSSFSDAMSTSSDAAEALSPEVQALFDSLSSFRRLLGRDFDPRVDLDQPTRHPQAFVDGVDVAITPHAGSTFSWGPHPRHIST